MNRPLLFSLLLGAATWTLLINSGVKRRAKVRAEDAAAKLRLAWAQHNTAV